MSVTSSFPSQPLCQVPQKQQQLVYPVSASASPNRRARSSIQTENPAVSTNNTTTTNAIRRLSDSNVRSIFECLYSNKPPPADLQFVIVPVGPNGEKLSPPSYEFDGKLVFKNTKTCSSSHSFTDLNLVTQTLYSNIRRWLVCPPASR